MNRSRRLPIARLQHPLSAAWPSLRLALVIVAVFLSPMAFAAAQEPTAEPPVYVVQPGDTLFRIAQQFGTTVDAIVAANNIADRALIQVGQKLVIPTAEPEPVPSPESRPYTRAHTVRPGEMLPALAFRYGSTVDGLREMNHLNRFGLLWLGQVLTIPPPTAAHDGLPGYPEVSIRPAPVGQGQTMLVEVEGGDGLDLKGSALAQDLMFVEEEGRSWALVGVDALTPAGGYPLALEATERVSGDLLSLPQTFTVTAGGFSAYNIVVPADRQNLLDPELAEAERQKVNAVFAGVSDRRLWAGVFSLPMAGELRPTSPFGQRRSYGGGPVSSYHTGQDYSAAEGTPVLAPITGTVALAEPLQVRGQAVILDHGLGVFSGFWHLSRIDVVAGQEVGQGDVIGLVGNTGLSTGPHLHWELRVLGVPVSPVQWTQQAFPSPAPEPEPPTPQPESPMPEPQFPIPNP